MDSYQWNTISSRNCAINSTSLLTLSERVSEIKRQTSFHCFTFALKALFLRSSPHPVMLYFWAVQLIAIDSTSLCPGEGMDVDKMSVKPNKFLLLG